MGKLKELNPKDYGMVLVKDLGTQYATEEKKSKTRYAIFICPKCGEEFKTDVSNARLARKRPTSMCKKCSMKMNSTRGKTHGLSKSHPLYNSWSGKKQRCNNPKAPGYADYGGRGITMCAEWANSFVEFVKYIEGLDSYAEKIANPDKKYTLDRIDNDGNYEPGNVRWATQTVQNHNQRKSKRNTSGYIGVSQVKVTGNWQSLFSYYDTRHINTFLDKEHAAMQYDLWVLKYNTDRTLNKPELLELYRTLDPDTYHHDTRLEEKIARRKAILLEEMKELEKVN